MLKKRGEARGSYYMKNKEKLSIAMLGRKRIPSCEGDIEIVVEELTSRRVIEGHSIICYNRMVIM